MSSRDECIMLFLAFEQFTLIFLIMLIKTSIMLKFFWFGIQFNPTGLAVACQPYFPCSHVWGNLELLPISPQCKHTETYSWFARLAVAHFTWRVLLLR